MAAILLALHPFAAAGAEHLVPSQYPSIQDAVDAASPGDTVRIATGDYYEQLFIWDKRDLAIVGEPGTVLHATSGLSQTLLPATATRAVVGLLRSDVSLMGLTVDGDQIGDMFSSSSGELQGVFFVGSSGRVQDCIIRNFRGSTLTDYSGARGLIIWNPVRAGGPAEINVQVISNTFEGNETCVAIAGDDDTNPTLLRTRFTIEGNSLTGFGGEALAIDGIGIYTGASGEVRGNTFENFNYTGSSTGTLVPFSSGVAAMDTFARRRNPPQAVQLHPIRFEANTFRNNDEHLVVLGVRQAEIVNNVFTGSGPVPRPWGALLVSGLNQIIANNNFADLPTGIFLFGSGDQILDNWPSVGVPRNTRLTGNWFSNVPQMIRFPSQQLTGIQIEGTNQPPFRPEFLPVSIQGDGLQINVRGWHGESVVLESSSDLRQWIAISTNTASLPLLELIVPTDWRAPVPSGLVVGGDRAPAGRGFFRIRKTD